MANRIDCINKDDRYNPHERIQSIGGPKDDGSRWRITLDEAIAGIEAGRWTFYVHAGGRVVDVVVAEHEGRKYLKTEADGYSPDNLLSLPECVG
jgi:hypothetical protein